MSLRRSYETKDDNAEDGGLVAYVKELVLKPFDIAFSRTARRAYLTTFLVIFSGLILFGLAVIAYALFYWSYIPKIGFERTIYLQFDNVYEASDSRYDGAGNPYGSVSLSSDVVSAQRYDIFIELTLPRTRENRDAGNFMLEASMYAAGTVVDPIKESIVPSAAHVENRLAHSRRPAILSYRSWPVEYLHRMTELHWYLLGWRNEAEKLSVSMWEGLEFGRGWRNVPSSMRLDIQSTHRMQIYSAKALFRARFRGLRWLMYNHRTISAITFITAFWTTEMIFAGLAWAALSFYVESPAQPAERGRSDEHKARIKQEDDEAEEKPQLSDTARTFPASSRQHPLRYESPQVKQEEEEDDAVMLLDTSNSKATEADDEDEDADVFLDSGLGTSMESSVNRRDSMRKRRGRSKSDDAMK